MLTEKAARKAGEAKIEELQKANKRLRAHLDDLLSTTTTTSAATATVPACMCCAEF